MSSVDELQQAEKETKSHWQRRWLSLWDNGLREIVIVGALFGCYRISSGVLPDSDVLAFQNAHDIVNLEKSLGLFVEQDFQSFFVDSSFLTHLVNTIYTIFYYPALIIFAIWAYIYHRPQYFVVRNILLVSGAIAFICFALYPTAPPRMLPELGFIDTTGSSYNAVNYDSPLLKGITNPYAAMPSVHFAWTLLAGTATIYIARTWWLKALGALIPLCMLVSIVATANHFILDAIAGVVVLGLAYGIVTSFSRLRKGAISQALEDQDGV